MAHEALGSVFGDRGAVLYRLGVEPLDGPD
jgi:hypothetical protein